MRPDIQGLEITKGELKRLSGVGTDRTYRPPALRKFVTEGLKTLAVIALVAISCLLLLLIFPRYYLLLIVLHLAAAVALIVDDVSKIWLSSRNKHLVNLFDDVDRYNAIIKAIEINDNIEEAGNQKVTIRNREQVIEALHLIREDLIRALKTERILRENKKFVASNADMFDTNFRALTALQINDRASEQGRLLNEALQIAVGVQEEMEKLQERHTRS
ncbi:hypothetical protein [Kamptonema sp. UHCC 0994]|uniref:hypothetical protein n=1 Tax=Kamptonema sp. UHCC 0994 TaxID=3031329 RepID=UPI0023BA1719|nr:hypothetical protein [Kamptonema sp. UHCC 0994]MDF0554829.1 hypothetical protein [Kamptonema sp. UHCC 0994]